MTLQVLYNWHHLKIYKGLSFTRGKFCWSNTIHKVKWNNLRKLKIFKKTVFKDVNDDFRQEKNRKI
jgi:hypothetical protein